MTSFICLCVLEPKSQIFHCFDELRRIFSIYHTTNVRKNFHSTYSDVSVGDAHGVDRSEALDDVADDL